MKRLLKFIFFVPLIWAYSLQAQVAVELSKMNILYIELANPMHIVANGVPHQDLRITCSDESAIIDSNGMFYIWPVRRGDLKIVIQNKNGDTLAVKSYRVRSIANPEIRFGTLQSGTYSRAVITAQPGIYATLGQYFAFEGVKFQVDSCYVRVLTLESEIICRQSGTATHPIIRKNLNEGLQSVQVYDAYVSRNNTDDVRSVSPLLIQSKDAIQDFQFYSGIQKNSISLSLNQCMIIPHDSVRYSDGGKDHFIQSNMNEKDGVPDMFHLIDDDTLCSIYDRNYRFFSEKGQILESGRIAALPDSISIRYVEGEQNRLTIGGVEFLTDTTMDFVPLELRKAYYPIGLWSYYHEIGQLKAFGEYKINKVVPDDTGC